MKQANIFQVVPYSPSTPFKYLKYQYRWVRRKLNKIKGRRKSEASTFTKSSYDPTRLPASFTRVLTRLFRLKKNNRSYPSWMSFNLQPISIITRRVSHSQATTTTRTGALSSLRPSDRLLRKMTWGILCKWTTMKTLMKEKALHRVGTQILKKDTETWLNLETQNKVQKTARMEPTKESKK